jgi:hypothetical protein
VFLSRSLLGFLLFCLLLVAVSAIGVWYMGPTLAGIVVDAETRENPYYLLQLVAADDPQRASAYRAQFLELAATDGAELRWQAGPLAVEEGSPLLAFDQAQLLRFPAGGDLVQMLTGSGYRQLAGQADGPRTLLLGSRQGPAEIPSLGAVVLALLELKADAGVDALGQPGVGGWLGTVAEQGGMVVWNVPLDTLRGDGRWNHLIGVHFPDTMRAEAWLTEPTTVTERAIAERVIEDALVLLAGAEPYQSR